MTETPIDSSSPSPLLQGRQLEAWRFLTTWLDLTDAYYMPCKFVGTRFTMCSAWHQIRPIQTWMLLHKRQNSMDPFHIQIGTHTKPITLRPQTHHVNHATSTLPKFFLCLEVHIRQSKSGNVKMTRYNASSSRGMEFAPLLANLWPEKGICIGLVQNEE